jgi:hypothetical protein
LGSYLEIAARLNLLVELSREHRTRPADEHVLQQLLDRIGGAVRISHHRNESLVTAERVATHRFTHTEHAARATRHPRRTPRQLCYRG